MHIIVPYNEILPKKKAHDIYLMQFSYHLSLENIATTVVCGKGVLPYKELLQYYGISDNPFFSISTFPIIRKNNVLRISWNFPFFLSIQNFLKKTQPDYVLFSVLKQAYFHLQRKQPKIHYIYEAHELAVYEPPSPKRTQKIALEKEVFQKADKIFVTTQPLQQSLLKPPYSLERTIDILPLAVNTSKLPPPPSSLPLKLAYVGQLYPEQGIDLLLHALVRCPMWTCDIIGGKDEEISFYKAKASLLNIDKRVHFLGFCPPKKIPTLIENCHAFVAPFHNCHRMPFVAHTKLLEYASWGRPIVAPSLPVVREHFSEDRGVLFFLPDDAKSLSEALLKLSEKNYLKQMQDSILFYQDTFTWKRRIQQFFSYTR